MKTVAEMREVTMDRVEDLGESGKKAAFAMVGAPVVAGKRIADYAGKGWKSLQKEFEAWVAEGERLSGEVRDGKVVNEIKERVDFDNLQGRVEKLKDQLEDVLTNWRENFKPAEAAAKVEPKAAPKTAAAKKPAAKKPAAKKPAAKKPAGKADAS
jgi:topoisomerase IA-like protein